MRANLQDSLEAFLKRGDLKIDHWFKELKSSSVIFDDANAFANVNTPEELKSLEAASV
jgi:molybdopterin-guanine dinucleotide biosynthesis protein A